MIYISKITILIKKAQIKFYDLFQHNIILHAI